MAFSVCPACGARLAPDAPRCDLCGHVPGDEIEAEPADEAPAAGPAAVAPVPASGQRFCVACGTANPDFARFCHQCGTRLHEAAAPAAVPVASPPPSLPPASPLPGAPARPPSDAGRRALVLLGAATLAVVALFFVTRWSQENRLAAARTAPPQQAQATASVLPPEMADQVAALEEAIDTAGNDAERLAARRDLISLLIRNGAFARAGELQAAVAEAEPTADAWADAGSFFLAQMLRSEDAPSRTELARRAVDAYERSLEIDPADLDVRTDLATAYLNDGQNPMKAVETVKQVLEEAPEHVRARFNYGLMLTQIGRAEQAYEQFERVVMLTEPDDPVRERAEQEVARLQGSAGPVPG